MDLHSLDMPIQRGGRESIFHVWWMIRGMRSCVAFTAMGEVLSGGGTSWSRMYAAGSTARKYEIEERIRRVTTRAVASRARKERSPRRWFIVREGIIIHREVIIGN